MNQKGVAFFLFLLLSLALAKNGYSTQYGSSSVSQYTSLTSAGTNDEAILRVIVNGANGGGGTWGITSIGFTMQNLNNASVDAAYVYYSASSSFSVATSTLKHTELTPTGSFTATIGEAGLGGNGNSYYIYLVYDISATANTCDYFDALVTTTSLVTSGNNAGSYTPTTNNPTGNVKIVGVGCQEYCSVSGLSSAGFGYLKHVWFNTISRSSVNDGYINTGIVTTVYPGLTYYLDLQMNNTTTSGRWTAAWIDYNNDGDFLDAGENVIAAGLSVVSGDAYRFSNVTIPLTAVTGTTRMRVVWKYAGALPEPAPTSCDTYNQYVDWEDYTINIFDTSIPPENDECTSATVLPIENSCTQLTFANFSATNSSNTPLPACANYAGKDVWFEAIVPASGKIAFDTDNSLISSAGMATYSGTCGALTLLTCDDNSSGNATDMPKISHSGLTPGSTVFVRMWEEGSDVQGDFKICAYDPDMSASNDDPCTATALTVSTVCSNTTSSNEFANSTSGVSNPTCASYLGSDVWFTAIVPASGNLDVTTAAGVMTDGAMAAYTAASCNGPFTQIGCNDDFTGTMPGLQLADLTPGETIYIRVYSWSSSTKGTFDICATEPTEGARCNIAYELNTPTSCGTYNNTGITGAVIPALSCLGAGSDNSMWFSFVADSGGVVITGSGAVGGSPINNIILALYEGTSPCAGLSERVGQCTNPNSPNAALNDSLLTVGETYYILVDGRGNNVGTFQLCINTYEPPPSSECTNATNVAIGSCVSSSNVGVLGVYEPTCIGTGTNNNKWFSFTPTSIGTDVYINAAAGASPLTNFRYTLLDSNSFCSNNNIAELVCYDAVSNYDSATYKTLDIGTKYYLLVDGDNNLTGTFDVCVSQTPPPSNDVPCTAQNLVVSNTCTYREFTNFNADASAVAAPTCGNYQGGDVWFSFVVPASGDVDISFLTGEVTNAAMSIYTSSNNACNGTLTQILCDDNSDPINFMPYAELQGLTPGNTIFIRVWEYAGDQNGTFSICVREPIPGERCRNAIEINSGDCLSQNNTGVAGTIAHSCIGTGTNNNQWYEFTADSTGILIQVDGAAGTLGNSIVSIFESVGGCGTLLAELDCDNPNTALSSLDVIGLTVGKTYHVLVDGRGSAVGSYEICATAYEPDPLPECQNATWISDSTCVTFSNAAVTGVFNPSCIGIGANNTMWFAFEATHEVIDIRVYGDSGAAPVGNVIVTLLDTNPTCQPPVNEILCTDANSPSFQYQYENFTPGKTYYILVDGDASLTGTFEICMEVPHCYNGIQDVDESGVDCGGLDCEPCHCVNGILDSDEARIDCGGSECEVCTNNPCEKAYLLVKDEPCQNGSTEGTSLESNESTACQANANQSVWYYFVASNDSMKVTVNRVASSCYFASNVWEEGDVCPSIGNSISCVPSSAALLLQEHSFTNLVVGNKYYVQVLYNTGSGCGTGLDFCISLDDLVILNNDLCAGAIETTLGEVFNLQNITMTADKSLCDGSTENNMWFYWTVPPTWQLGSKAFVHLFNQSCDNTSGMQLSVFDADNCSQIPDPAIFSDCIFSSNTQTVNDIYYEWEPNEIGNTYYFNLDGYAGALCDFNFMVSNSSCLTSLITGSVPSSCGDNDGVATAIASNGSEPYTFAWSSPINVTSTATNSVDSNLLPGVYTLTVTDNLGCTTTGVVEVEIDSVQIVIDILNNVLCFGESSGSATVNVTGGRTPYAYFWSNGETTQTAVSLPVGAHSVSVTEASTPTLLWQDDFGDDAVACASYGTLADGFSTATGLWTTTNTGTNAAEAHTWFISSQEAGVGGEGNCADGCYTGLSATNRTLHVGFYNISGVDNEQLGAGYLSGGLCGFGPAACVETDIRVESPSIDVSTFTNIKVNFNYFEGGNSLDNATFYYFNGTSWNLIDDMPKTAVGGCAQLAEWNSYTVSLPSDAGDISNLKIGIRWVNNDDGDYTPVRSIAIDDIQITGSPLACFSTASITITEPSSPLVYSVSCTDASSPLALDGSSSSSVSGGDSPYYYLWSNGAVSSSVTGLAVGTYAVTITDANGCEAVDNCSVNSAGGCAASISSFNDASCFGYSDGSATAALAGSGTSFTYLWSNAKTTATVTGLDNGTYTVTITDNLSCSSSVVVTISQPTDLTLTINGSDLKCFSSSDGSAFVIANGGPNTGYTYLWSDGETTDAISGKNAGIYNVVVSSNFCSQTAVTTLTEPTSITATTTNTSVTCNGLSNGTATVSASGGPNTDYTYLWSNTATSSSISGLGIGTYTVTVTSGTCTTTVTTIIYEPSLLSTSITSTNTSCGGSFNGTATVSALGGPSTDYTYVWSNSETTDNISSLTNGNYTVTVSSGTCNSISSVVVSDDNDFPIILVDACNNVTAIGASDGSITVSVSGSEPPYSYSWLPPPALGQTTETATGLPTGTYSVIVSAANGCSSMDGCTINNPGCPVSISITENSSALCFGSSNGSATAEMSGGGTVFTYLWSDGQTTQQASNLDAGNYFVTITDNLGCIATTITSIDEPEQVLVSITSQQDANCNGSSDGFAESEASGGVSGYSFQWSDSQTTATASNLAFGSYIVTVTDGNACTSTTSVSIGEPELLLVSLNCVNPATIGGSDGYSNSTVTGGDGNYTYNWSDGQTSVDAINLSAGVIQVTISDGNGCMAEESCTLTDPTCTVSITLSAVETLCFGSSDGSASVSISSGLTPYSYQWSNSETTDNIFGLVASEYSVTVTDASLCSEVGTITVTEPLQILASISCTPTSISGNNDGASNVAASGGTGLYNYLWSNGGTDAAISGLISDTYSVTVSDQNSCSVVESCSVEDPACAVSVTVNSVDAICNGASNGSASASALGGMSPYSFVWSNGATESSVTGIAAGIYEVTVTDLASCSTISSITIGEPSAVAVTTSVISDATCNASDGSASLLVSGSNTPYTYLWSNGETGDLATGLAAGTYTVTAFDVNLCNSSAEVSILNLNGPNIVFNKTDIQCFGFSDGQIEALVSGGTSPYLYTWNNGGTNAVIANLSEGIYSLTVTNNDGSCSIVDSETIFEPSLLVVDATVNNVLCNSNSDGAIVLNVSGGITPYTYLWDNLETASSITGLALGTKLVTVTDANICSIEGSYTITEPSVLDVDSIVQHVSCFGLTDGQIDILTYGGTTPYSYSWSNGETNSTISGLGYGLFVLTLTDYNGCTINQGIEIFEPLELAISTSITMATCGNSDGQIDVAMVGGTTPYNYFWSNSVTSDSNVGLFAGNYSLTVTDENLCTASWTGAVTNPSAHSVSISISEPLCFGVSNGIAEAIISDGVGPFEFIWSNGNTEAVNGGLAAGILFVTVLDTDNSCIAFESATMTEPSELVVNVNVLNASCGLSDGQITTTVSGGVSPYSYGWSNGNTEDVVSNLSPATYLLTVSDFNGCDVTYSNLQILEKAGPAITSIVPLQVTCNGLSDGSAYVSASGGNTPYTYLWSNGQTEQAATNLATGEYSVTVSDVGCTDVSQVTISEPNPITINLQCSNETSPGLSDGAANISEIGGNGTYSYLWSDGSTENALSGLSAGAVEITVTDILGCFAIESCTVSSAPCGISVTLNGANISCFGNVDGSINSSVNSGLTPYTYSWSNGSTEEQLSGLTYGLYVLTVTDALGCSVTESHLISEPLALALTATIINQPSCSNTSDGVASVSAFGGTTPYVFVWDDASTTDTNVSLSGGTHMVIVLDSNSCSTSVDVVLTAPAPLSTFSYPQSEFCSYDIAILPDNILTSGGVFSSSTGLSINSATGEIDASNSPLGFHEVQYIISSSCIDTSYFNITISNGPDAYFSYASTLVCQNTLAFVPDSITTIGGVFTSDFGVINPQTGSIDVNGMVVGTTILITYIANDGLCSDSSEVSLTVLQNPASPLVADIKNYCNGDVINALVSGDNSTLWYDNSSLQNLLTQGATMMPSLELGLNDFYAVNVSSDGCFSSSSEISIQLFALPITSSSDDISICVGEKIQIFAEGGVSYLWSPNTYLTDSTSVSIEVKPTTTTTYSAIVTDVNGCTSLEEVLVTVDEDPFCLFDIYNAFTPNGDGKNDLWKINGIENFDNVSVQIFNRWGDKIWETDDYDNVTNVWNGVDNKGNEPASGVFFYIMNVEGEIFRGHVEIVK